MGSYFSKKPKPKEVSFESLERKIEALNPNSYPSFEKSVDWSKTKHVYSDSFCVKEKYVSYGFMSILFLFVMSFLFSSFRSKKSDNLVEQNDQGQQIIIGEDMQ